MDITGKIALIGDTHFARKVNNKLVKGLIDQGQLDYFNSLSEELKEKGVDTIMFTGDVHDTRNSIDVKALVNTKRLLEDTLSDFDVHIITGNHDMYYENDYDIISLELFNNISNVTIHLKEFTKLNVNGYDWHMIPWLTNDRIPDFIEYSETIEDKDNSVLFGHFEMLDIDMEGGNISIHGTDQDIYTKYAKYIFSGHYHGKSITEVNGSIINYVGSPYPLTFANANQEHGIWVIDEEMNSEFLPNIVSPEFTNILDTDDFSKLESLDNSFVKLYMLNTAKEKTKFDIMEKIKSLKPLHITRVYYKEDESDVSVSEDNVNEAMRKTNLTMSALFSESVKKRAKEYSQLDTIENVSEAIVSTVDGFIDELKL
jgi:DNA repair exonuclease SbcCD nuclease subunit